MRRKHAACGAFGVARGRNGRGLMPWPARHDKQHCDARANTTVTIKHAHACCDTRQTTWPGVELSRLHQLRVMATPVGTSRRVCCSSCCCYRFVVWLYVWLFVCLFVFARSSVRLYGVSFVAVLFPRPSRQCSACRLVVHRPKLVGEHVATSLQDYALPTMNLTAAGCLVGRTSQKTVRPRRQEMGWKVRKHVSRSCKSEIC